MLSKVLFSSEKMDWGTPRKLMRVLRLEYGKFDIDLAASAENAKCEKYFDEEDNSLRKKWRGLCFLNPPYGRDLGVWIQRAYEQAQKYDSVIICLVPARVDTQWFHDWGSKAARVRFLKGRIRFEGAKAGAPFPSCILEFRKDPGAQVVDWYDWRKHYADWKSNRRKAKRAAS